MKPRRALPYALGATLLLPWVASAQDKPAETEKPKTGEAKAPGPERRVNQRLVMVKNVGLMDDLMRLADGFGVRHNESRELGVIVLSGSAESVAAAAEAIQRFDAPRPKMAAAPRRNAEFTAFLVLARMDGEGVSVPAAVMPAVEQLKNVLPYKRYELLETLMLRVDGEGGITGTLPPLQGAAAKTFYNLQLNRVIIRGGEPGAATVSIGKLSLNLEVPVTIGPGEAGKPASYQYRNNSISTSFDVREGQKAVVGKSAIDGTGTSLILVLTVKIVD